MDISGVFRPQMPSDVSEVLLMYAIAARVIIQKPDEANEVTKRLGILCSQLVPPELIAAQQCGRMWMQFARMATAGNPTLREQAGRAFVRDLDQVGRSLEVPPLPGWDGLPLGVDAPGAPVMDLSDTTSPGQSLEIIKKRAAELKKKAKDKGLKAQDTAELVRALFPEERDKLFAKLIGEGILGRSEISLLVRWLSKGEKLGKDDDALSEVLASLGNWLVR
jgi:hypothetical protein